MNITFNDEENNSGRYIVVIEYRDRKTNLWAYKNYWHNTASMQQAVDMSLVSFENADICSIDGIDNIQVMEIKRQVQCSKKEVNVITWEV